MEAMEMPNESTRLASGGGTYTSEAFFKDTLAAGKYKATIELP
jgi:hypothetical protein